VSSRVFVTGATGVVGSHLAAMLVSDGHDVTALVRSDAAAQTMDAAGIKSVRGDIRDPSQWSATLGGMDAVFHIAGVNEACPSDPDVMDAVNVDGAVAVVEASADAGVGRVVLTSSVAAIGEAMGAVGTEATLHSGVHVSAYARSKHRGEMAAVQAAADRGVDLVVVNPASVQGPGRSTGSAEMLLRVLRARRPLLIDVDVSIVDIEDCSRGHILAWERGTAGERYILSGSTLSVGAIVNIVNASIAEPVHPRWLSPRIAHRVGVPVASIVSKLARDSGVCADLVRTMLHGHRFSNDRSRTELGVIYTPIEATVARTLEWFRDEGLVERTAG